MTKLYFVLFFAISGLLSLCVGQHVIEGQCDLGITVSNTFTLDQLEGQWYEIERTPGPQRESDCVQWEFTSNGGDGFIVFNKSVNKNFRSESRGSASKSSDSDDPAKLQLYIDIFESPIDFWILRTGVITIAYSCENLTNLTQSINLWILSRDSTYPNDELGPNFVNTTLNTLLGFGREVLGPVDQSYQACYELPPIDPGVPVILTGQCDKDKKAQEKFNVAEFTGTWHQISSYFSESSNGDCARAEYSAGNGVVDLVNTQVIDRKLLTLTGNASLISDDESAKLKVIINIRANETVEQNLWILGTDYKKYAVSYSCENLEDNRKRIYSWILSRERSLTPDALPEVENVINSHLELNSRFYEPTKNGPSDCFYYPEPNGRPVLFRAQCDENISVQNDFDIVKYMGLWHNIDLYPAEFQGGECSNAFYVLGDEGVDVRNTQVVNGILDVRTAFGVSAGEDGTGKLRVTFPIAGTNDTVTTDYWVLETNYESYALVYSCQNIGPESMRVNSWKLSRSKTLAEADRDLINSKIDEIEVLDRQYYEIVNQTEESCFFVPIPKEGEPVKFSGKCKPAKVMSEFSVERFARLWFEVEAYPKIEQRGQCVRHEYSFYNNSQLNLKSLSVDDYWLSETQSIVSASDGTGMLNITVKTSDGDIFIPFWVVDTDYETFAVAYACVDQEDGFQGVWSWKLSNSTELLDTAELAIESAIEDIDVLEEKYYWEVNHSETACFHLPDISPGDPIILDGQCETDITGITNFDATKFLGRWRFISSYYADNQTGTCNEVNFSNLNGLNLDVTHTQVLLGNLESASGTATADSNGRGSLTVTLADSEPAEYLILDVDYSSYALLYRCQDQSDNKRRVWSWKLSRNKTLSDTAEAAIDTKISEILVLHSRYYQPIKNSFDDCFYYPKVNSTSPVSFRGQCSDIVVPVKKDFQPSYYTGLWHDIESYPEVFQSGTCNNAYYTARGGGVDVLNTQVIKLKLDTMEGRAEIDTDDGTARLNVTFNVEGVNVTANYLVLETDYTRFSLVYSCRPDENDDDYVIVSSWKLSRNKELSTEAKAEINAVTAGIPVLSGAHYVERNQTTEGCFYFPAPAPNEPVIFSGRCDPNIDTKSEFNLTQFEGVWHEVAKYPYALNDQCIDHRFTLQSSTSLNQTSFRVENQSLIQIANSLTPATINDPKLTINIVVDGVQQQVPFWIVDTDYEDYALAYGCRNLEGIDYRQIYSWKLSRTRQQTPEGAASINDAIEKVDVLKDKYYDTTAQSDEACFYLPELGESEPVTFIGQCDPNIKGVSDFNAAAYLGRWRLIESYYAEFQRGTCIEADYSLGENSVVVVNSYVENEELVSLTGSAVVAADDGTGKLLVTFPGNDTGTEYYILGTDYETYALVYSCRNLTNDRRQVWSWKMSRTNGLTEKATDEIDKIVNEFKDLNEDYYTTIGRGDSECFYFPPAERNKPVVFPGQCDTNIAVQADFNVAAYLGTWYGVESYPAPFQTGSCSKAEYLDNGDGTVAVKNTQVKNRLQETWIGSAVQTSPGKLNVTFNINGENVTTSYWVLGTNYINYALVYSCENIDEYSRAVFSWKLSKAQNLTEEAEEAINALVADIQVLDERYYFKDGYTFDDCFYYPDNEGRQVELPGVCDSLYDVPVVEEFNATAFAGVWYEVSRFPALQLMGACTSTKLLLDRPDRYSMTHSFVHNERQVNETSLATIDGDNRAILYPSFSETGFSRFYILATDYKEFALVYDCINIGPHGQENPQKRVNSWKLSRFPNGLSDDANKAIDKVVESTFDLWEGYYITNQHDADACFHYPNIDNPEAIELPGSCPNDIHGVADFRPGDYLGQWYETARYPVRNQFGQCSRAYYSLNPDASDGVLRVDIDNEEVAQQTLFNQLGYANVSNSGRGELSVEFVVDGDVRTLNYYILATDYHSSSLVYSCMNLPNGWRQVSSWKLSRNKILAPNDDIDQVIEKTEGLNPALYVPTGQSDEDCFYIPFNHVNIAPTFRGRCENVAAVEDFDIEKFAGWWHEIESYDVDGGHEGDCRSTDYSRDGNVVRVVDSWVKDNEGSSREGTVVATPDGILRKTLPDNRVQDIYVLDTDYESYALLYSCENIDDEYRIVWSAKHSRVRSLSTAANTAMDVIIASNRVLYSQFYRTVSQSDATCFYYPNITNGEVIIPGQCDEEIPVQAPFNITQFAGIWYHAERYDAATGNLSCVGTRYIPNDSAIVRVNDVEVIDAEEIHAAGNATVGDRALIQHTFGLGSPGVWGNSSVHVLATDYTNYAVVYNCVNEGPFRRQVRAWKLSRSRQLSEASSSTIATLIQGRQALHQPYFKQIAQREDCPDPNSALLMKSSIIVLFVGVMLQWLL